MLVAIAVLCTLTASLAALLMYGERHLAPQDDAVVARIEAALPHIQCGQCGYPGCKPYAEALARGEAAINLCPPGGTDTVRRLAELLGRDAEPVPNELGSASLDCVAVIDESACIGCGLCRPVCPVDAILGIGQMMHTVIASLCTGCERCVPPCPVDCVQMLPRDA